jgi:subtilisin
MATPHVTGLAALILAHHPLLQPKQQNEQRVAQLFQILRACAIPYIGDAARGGAGLPNALVALGQTAASPQPVTAQPASGAMAGALAGNALMGGVGGLLGGLAGQLAGNPLAGLQLGGAHAVSGSLLGPSGYQSPLLAALLSNPAAVQTLAQLRALGLL